MKLSVFTQNGKKGTKTVEVEDTVFAAKPNSKLLAQYIFVYLSNQRASIAHTKDKSEVSGGGRKPWAQKGSGRARHGSNRSPIWTGGGVTFGPTNARNWKKNMSKKMKARAIAAAFTKLASDEKLKIVDEIKFEESQLTKQAAKMMEDFGNPRKVTIVTPEKNSEVIKAFSNIPNAKVVIISELNAYDVANAGEMILLQYALEYTKHWSK